MNEVDILEKEYVDETSWSGDLLGVLAGLTYYLKKYPNTCFPIKVFQPGQGYNLHPFIKYNCYNKDKIERKTVYETAEEAQNCRRLLEIPHGFENGFRKCQANPNIRFIIGLIRIIYYYPLLSGHTNAFIYDKNDNSIEVFEPHGSRPASRFSDVEYQNALNVYFKNELKVSNIFYNDFCPAFSFQSLQVQEEVQLETDPFGFCQSWVLWWIDYRLSNSNSKLSRKELVDAALVQLNEKPKYFTTFIRNYSEFILKQRDKMLSDIFERLQRSDEGQLVIRQLVEQDKLENKIASLERKKSKLAGEMEKISKLLEELREQLRPLSAKTHTNLQFDLIEEFQRAIDLAN